MEYSSNLLKVHDSGVNSATPTLLTSGALQMSRVKESKMQGRRMGSSQSAPSVKDPPQTREARVLKARVVLSSPQGQPRVTGAGFRSDSGQM